MPENIIKEICYSKLDPPIILYDTNIWYYGNEKLEVLKKIKEKYKFDYHFSSINFLEAMSHLTDSPSKQTKNPLSLVKSLLGKMLN
jgi:hypothetical protein